jgi:hypothetical protein
MVHTVLIRMGRKGNAQRQQRVGGWSEYGFGTDPGRCKFENEASPVNAFPNYNETMRR